VTAVAAGGEVIVLDSAGYGPVTLTKSVSLIAPAGVYAGVTVTMNDGIDVNAPGGVVNLVGLNITNVSSGIAGVSMINAAQLHIERLVVTGFLDEAALKFHPGSDGRFTVRDSELRFNFTAIDVSFVAEGSVDHVRMDDDDYGVIIQDTGKITVRDSVFYDGTVGLEVNSTNTTVEANVVNCLFFSGNFGIFLFAQNQSTAIARFSDSTFVNLGAAIAHSTSGIATGTMSLVSFGNNQFHGNATDGTPDTTIALK
jgi:hypothetical protein